jgi:phosphoglycerate dehydrogenase-like enzyme
MHPYTVLLNIARGGIVHEAAVVQALKEKQISGYATDVFQVEPAGGPEGTPLLEEDTKDLNITMSPHLAWSSARTIKNLGDMLKETMRRGRVERRSTSWCKQFRKVALCMTDPEIRYEVYLFTEAKARYVLTYSARS